MLEIYEANSLRMIFQAVNPDNLPDVLATLNEVFNKNHGAGNKQAVAMLNKLIIDLKMID